MNPAPRSLLLCLVGVLAAPGCATSPRAVDVRRAVGLLLGAPEFQKQ